ncbi:MAG TPA: pseudouridine-5'-phosphate glycosidase [Trueperaceae bacterium]|nr:pseudouridine-5'-phosphate glycosidase [Trueperaceae bacterium]
MTSAARLRISKPVADAISAREPVVALESTVITHGLPRPRNLEAGRRLEAVVTAAGARPATVGVIGGELVVGLDADELAYLASANADKASTWNLAAICARGDDAGTTVATTLFAAHAAGIDVFATGGIGGVHHAPFDESADLLALARFPVLTVCAGPKSILDAAATLERLESHGVGVVGYGSDRLAGFLVAETELPVPASVASPEAAAAILRAQRELGLGGGVLLCKPVSRGLEPAEFDQLRASAQAELESLHVGGRDTTPFLLSALARLSGGKTVEVNTRLLEENASLAAKVAAALVRAAAGRQHSVPVPGGLEATT